MLAENVFDFAEERASLWAVFHFERGTEFLQEFALALGEFGGRLHADLHKQVAGTATIENWNTLILDAHGVAGLRAFGNFERLVAAQGGDGDFRAQRGLHEGNGNDAAEVIAFALEKLVLFHMQNNVKVAGLATKGAGFTKAAEADAGAVFDSGGNFGFDGALAKKSALAAALRAWIGDDLTQTLASGTGAGDAEKALLMADLAMAVAGAAGDGRFSRRCAGSATGFASFMTADIDGFFDAEDGFLEFQLQIFAQVGSALNAATLLATAAAEQVEAKEVAKDIVEIVEDSFIEAAASSVDSGVTEAVVGGALIAISQDGIGLGGFFEALFGGRVAGVAIGVVLHGELAVGAFDFLFACAAFYSENFVVIAFCVGCQSVVLGTLVFLQFLFPTPCLGG